MSTKSIGQKLQLKEGQRFLLLNPPKGYREALGELPNNLTLLSAPKGEADVIQTFISSKQELESQLVSLKQQSTAMGIIWITYPKGTSKIKTDVNRDIIRKYAHTLGLEAIAIFSVDISWAALRLKKL